MVDLQTMVAKGLQASVTSFGSAGDSMMPQSRSEHLAHIHRDTVISPEQLRQWMNRDAKPQGYGSVYNSPSRLRRVRGHTRERAELEGSRDESLVNPWLA
ncbi:hypothetical protein SPI_04485 [Niveomyces insectorum RCEF 264]|uniref:Uncharacterized protein n=1 Tax=Niveomyces insectorum RCEF 264 TaxID=1081102 RepID=A0A167UJ10_9HYPO|nr:hypothetical protein SPI_04485 [Niveomyces insectorum RCEF 264]